MSPALARAAFGIGAMLALVVAAAPVAATSLNGTWRVDAAASQDLEEEGKAYNEAQNAARRGGRQEFHDDRPRSRNRFQAAADATAALIREDARSNQWFADPDVAAIADADTIKIYQGRRVAVLYDGDRRRLLTINPEGRAFSYSGGEVSTDDFGRSLTYVEDDGTLVIETALHVGGRIVERFALANGADRLRLLVSYRQRASLPPIELERFYDRVE